MSVFQGRLGSPLVKQQMISINTKSRGPSRLGRASSALPSAMRPLALILPALLAVSYGPHSAADEALPVLKLALLMDEGQVVTTGYAAALQIAQLAQATPAPFNTTSMLKGEAGYQAALQLAREGKALQAAQYLAFLRREHPDDLRMLHDYVAVSTDAGRYADALAEVGAIDRNKAPAYVIEALARAARGSGNAALALQLYDDILARSPDRAQAMLAKIYTLADAGQQVAAISAAESALTKQENNAQLWEAYGYALRAAGRPAQALEAYQRMAALDPTGSVADKARVNMLSSLGAAHEAAQIAEGRAGLVEPPQMLQLKLDRAAARIRWSDADEDTKTQRYRNTDLALRDLDDLLQQIKQSNAAGSPLERRVLADKTVALVNRKRYQDAVDLYAGTAERGALLPGYARMAAGDAYLGVKRPDEAKRIFEKLVADEPRNLGYRYGLFYALSDLEQHQQAQAVVDELVRLEPRILNRNIPELARENPGYIRARVLAMMVRAYADDLPEANRRADELVSMVPFNRDVHSNRGYIYYWRGWPRKADEEFRWLLAVAPENLEAKLGRVTALAGVEDWRASDAQLNAIAKDSADDKQVKSALRRSAVHHMRELTIDANGGNDSQAINASRDRNWEARLYSQPLDDVWRVYARSVHARATLPNSADYSRHREGVGVEYKARDWLLDMNVTHLSKVADADASRTGVKLNLFNEINDLYRLRASYENADESLPVRAAAAGINGKRALLGMTVRDNEMHRASADVQRHNFSDGNRRTEWGAAYSNLFSAEYQRRFTLGIGLSGMRNTLQGTPYFNPSRSLSTDFSLTGEWLQWRTEQTSLWHRVGVSAGTFDQEGFANLPTARISYELDWNASDTSEIKLGAGRSMHPYDGVQDFRNYLTFSLNRRF